MDTTLDNINTVQDQTNDVRQLFERIAQNSNTTPGVQFNISPEQLYNLVETSGNEALPFTEKLSIDVNNPFFKALMAPAVAFNRLGAAFSSIPADLRALYATLFNPEESRAILREKQEAEQQGFYGDSAIIGALMGKPTWYDRYMNWVQNVPGAASPTRVAIAETLGKTLGMTPYVIAGKYLPEIPPIAKSGMAAPLMTGLFGVTGALQERPEFDTQANYTGNRYVIDPVSGGLMLAAPFASGLAGKAAGGAAGKIAESILPKSAVPYAKTAGEVIGHNVGFGAAFTTPELINNIVQSAEGEQPTTNIGSEFIKNTLMGVPFSVAGKISEARMRRKIPSGIETERYPEEFKAPGISGVERTPISEVKPVAPAEVSNVLNSNILDFQAKLNDITPKINSIQQSVHQGLITNEPENVNSILGKSQQINDSINRIKDLYKTYQDNNNLLNELNNKRQQGTFTKDDAIKYNQIVNELNQNVLDITEATQSFNSLYNDINNKANLVIKANPDIVNKTQTVEGIIDFADNVKNELNDIISNPTIRNLTTLPEGLIDNYTDVVNTLNNLINDVKQKATNNTLKQSDLLQLQSYANDVKRYKNDIEKQYNLERLIKKPVVPEVKEPDFTKSEVTDFETMLGELQLNPEEVKGKNPDEVKSIIINGFNSIGVSPQMDNNQINRFVKYTIQKYNQEPTPEEQRLTTIKNLKDAKDSLAKLKEKENFTDEEKQRFDNAFEKLGINAGDITDKPEDVVALILDFMDNYGAGKKLLSDATINRFAKYLILYKRKQPNSVDEIVNLINYIDDFNNKIAQSRAQLAQNKIANFGATTGTPEANKNVAETKPESYDELVKLGKDSTETLKSEGLLYKIDKIINSEKTLDPDAIVNKLLESDVELYENISSRGEYFLNRYIDTLKDLVNSHINYFLFEPGESPDINKISNKLKKLIASGAVEQLPKLNKGLLQKTKTESAKKETNVPAAAPDIKSSVQYKRVLSVARDILQPTDKTSKPADLINKLRNDPRIQFILEGVDTDTQNKILTTVVTDFIAPIGETTRQVKQTSQKKK